MSTPRDQFIEVEGLRLHYLEWGKRGAPTVVLVHGSSAHAHWWDLFGAAIADEFYVVAPDLRGHGDSAHVASGDYSLECYADDIAALTQRLDLGPLRIVGHSLGALVATVFAFRSRLAIDALALVDCTSSGVRAGSRPFLDRLRQFPHPIYATREEAIRRFRLLPTGTAASSELLAHVASHGLTDTGDGRFTLKFDRSTLVDRNARDISAELSVLRCPILYVRGEKSAVATPKAAAELRSVVPRAGIAVVPNAYHHVMLDNPAGFESAVRPFLRSVEVPIET